MFAPAPHGIDPRQVGIQFVYLVMLKRGLARSANHAVSITVTSPSGKELRPMGADPLAIEFVGDEPDAGVNLQIKIGLQPSEEGLYWLEVSIDGRASARTPFRLIRQETISAS
jgi:hypothetical protein